VVTARLADYLSDVLVTFAVPVPASYRLTSSCASILSNETRALFLGTSLSSLRTSSYPSAVDTTRAPLLCSWTSETALTLRPTATAQTFLPGANLTFLAGVLPGLSETPSTLLAAATNPATPGSDFSVRVTPSLSRAMVGGCADDRAGQMVSLIGPCMNFSLDASASANVGAGSRALTVEFGIMPAISGLGVTGSSSALPPQYQLIGRGLQLTLSSDLLATGTYTLALVTRNFVGRVSNITTRTVRRATQPESC
jgi:hypothetical protein